MRGNNNEPQIASSPAVRVTAIPERVSERRSEPHALPEEQNSVQKSPLLDSTTPQIERGTPLDVGESKERESTVQSERATCENEEIQMLSTEASDKSDYSEDVQLKTSHQEQQQKASIQQIATEGFSGGATALPHKETSQKSFGTDLSDVRAYIGGVAADACEGIGALAYGSGNQIAFKEQPNLELVAHEAVHVEQQKSGKVQLDGGVGKVGDKYEQHADAVVAKVGAGESVEQKLSFYVNPELSPSQSLATATPSKLLAQNAAHPNSKNTENPSAEVYSFRIVLPDNITSITDERQLKDVLLRDLIKQVFRLSDSETETEVKHWSWRVFNRPNAEQIAAKLWSVNVDKQQYDLTIARLYRTNQEEIGNRLGTTEQRRDNFYTSGNFENFNASLEEVNTRYNRITREGVQVGQIPANQQLWGNIQEQLLLERATLEALSPEVKYLLGGEDSFQPCNYEQLLKVGRKIQQLPPEEIKYVYKPFLSEIVGDIPRLERSIDIFTNTRTTVLAQLRASKEDYSGQAVNNLLFGKNPATQSPQWQQVIKDLIVSVLQSPKYAPDVLGEVFDHLKEHWVEFVALTVALIGAEAVVAFLTGLPEPTFLSKIVAVALQGFILLVYGAGIFVSLENAINELMNWWNAASIANGNPQKIEEASYAFLRMILSLVLVIVSSRQFKAQIGPEKRAGLEAMLGRRQQLPRLPDNHEGATLNLVYDRNTGSYVYRLQPNPNAALGPSRPPVSPSTLPSGSQPPKIPTHPTFLPTPEAQSPLASPGQTPPPALVAPTPPVTIPEQPVPSTSTALSTNGQTTFAEPPQVQNPIPGLIPNTPDSSSNIVGQAEPVPPVNSGASPTNGAPTNQTLANLAELNEKLQLIGITLNSQELHEFSEPQKLPDSRIEQLVRSAGIWTQVKANYLSYPLLMKRITDYRAKVVAQTVQEIRTSNPELQLNVLLTDKQGNIIGSLIEMVIAGSADLTSDYDVTFSATKPGQEAAEILAVDKFNELFRQTWDLEPGYVFDTNVYTSGHMRPEAFTGDAAKLNLVKEIAKKLKVIKKKEGSFTQEQPEINDLVGQVNNMQNVQSTTKLRQLTNRNFDTFTLQVTQLQRDLQEIVKQQYQSSKNAYGAGPEFDELATVMSLVHMREFLPQGQPSEPNWTYVEERMTGSQIPEDVRNANQERLERVRDIHTELVDERSRKTELLEQENPNSPKGNREMMANNLLYVEYLQRVSAKLNEVRAAEQSGAPLETVQALKLQLQELQSKALFFANEAYMTAISAEQVVLNQQLGLEVELPTAQYLASINEQTAFIGEQISHNQDNFGKALWKTAKYTDRLLTAIETIYAQTNKVVPSGEVMTRVGALKPLVTTLINDIKKNADLNDAQRNQAAADLAKANSSVLGANTAELGRIILDLQINVNLEVQEYLNTNNRAQ